LWPELDEKERKRLAARHARFFQRWVVHYYGAEGKPYVSEPHPAAIERANVEASFHWHVARADHEATMAMIEGLRVMRLLDLCPGAQGWCETIAQDETKPVRLRRRTLWLAASVTTEQPSFEHAVRLLEAAAALRCDPPEEPAQAGVLFSLAHACHHAGRYEEALRWAKEAASEARRIGAFDVAIHADRFQCEILGVLGRLEEGLQTGLAALATARDLPGPPPAVAEALYQVATLHRRLGHCAEAAACYEESLGLRLILEDPHGIADCLRGLALLQMENGQTEQAWANVQHALHLYGSLGKRGSYAAGLGDLAEILWRRGDAAGALDRLEEALAIWREDGHRGWLESVARRIDEMAAALDTEAQDPP
jgi:tetratricopeptide (TPR) repeat protein